MRIKICSWKTFSNFGKKFWVVQCGLEFRPDQILSLSRERWN